MGTSGALAATTPELPAVIQTAMRQAGEARRDGRLDLLIFA